MLKLDAFSSLSNQISNLMPPILSSRSSLMSTSISFPDFDCYKVATVSFSSPCACPLRPSSCKPLPLPPSSLNFNRLHFVLHGQKGLLGINKRSDLARRHIVAVAHAEPDRIDEKEPEEEVEGGEQLSFQEDPISEHQHKKNQLKKRIIFGLGIGITVGLVVLTGGWVFTVAVAACIFVGAREYFELVRSRGITAGMTPPPRYVSRSCSVICAFMPILSFYFGQLDVAITFSAFILAITLLLQRGSPRFAQLSSAIFGLFYCGYLPCFWVKLRCGLAVPAINTEIGAGWPFLLGGRAHWTVGLVATLISMSSIIAADTFAFLGGKAFGKTPLTNISPKKTWEGTIMGLGGCIATSVILSKILCWPSSMISAIAFGFLNFLGSVFGDLTESMIKRDAGVKDSGSLIPGHGGLLDRVDSYIFSGALAYSYIKAFMPLYGV